MEELFPASLERNICLSLMGTAGTCKAALMASAAIDEQAQSRREQLVPAC